jgi:hypothetical protein
VLTHIVADDVPVALVGVHAYSEPSGVTNSIGGPTTTTDGREPNIRRCGLAGVGKDLGGGEAGERSVELELSKGAGTTSMDSTLGDTLVVKVGDLFAVVVI